MESFILGLVCGVLAVTLAYYISKRFYKKTIVELIDDEIENKCQGYIQGSITVLHFNKSYCGLLTSDMVDELRYLLSQRNCYTMNTFWSGETYNVCVYIATCDGSTSDIMKILLTAVKHSTTPEVCFPFPMSLVQPDIIKVELKGEAVIQSVRILTDRTIIRLRT